MKISPIDIRQHTFEKGFRGYNTDEVNAFLNSLSQEWERVINENKMLKMQLEIAEKELNKLKDIEMTLFRTLKTAEDTSQQITEQAHKAAEKYLGESRQKSDETVNEAKRKASMLIQDAENEAKYIKEEIINELKNQERDFKAMEKYRDNLVVQLKSLVNNTHETVERFEKKFNKETFAQRMGEIKAQVAGTGTKPTEEENAESAEPGTEEQEVVATEAMTTENSETTAASEEVAMAETEEEPVATEEAEVEAAAPLESSRISDAAADALAEVEKMKEAREKAEEKETSPEATATEPETTGMESSEEEDPKGKGSFFDQIR